ncbi:MAG: nucleoside-diphosphate kinase [Candidatus Thermoplasmatota archaeon]|nr:nucleoside-diphosphate kinase [Candidatus Thermoplasmatota archaeon]
MERTFVMAKPDAVQRGLVGEIVSRFERKGLKIIAAKFIKIQRDTAEEMYAEHKAKPFFEGHINFILSGPVLAVVLEGESAISLARAIIGKTNPLEAQAGTIRGDFCQITRKNLVHGSDGPENAKREVSIFFKPEDILEYKRNDESCFKE